MTASTGAINDMDRDTNRDIDRELEESDGMTAMTDPGFAPSPTFGQDRPFVAEQPAGLTRAASELAGTGADIQTVAADLTTREGVHTLYQTLLRFMAPPKPLSFPLPRHCAMN